MSREPSIWEKLSDAMPWNRKKVQDREQLERDVMDLAYTPPEPASSAAEAMAAMRQESKSKRVASTAKKDETNETDGDSGGNTDLRDRWKDSAAERPSAESLREITRKKGG